MPNDFISQVSRGLLPDRRSRRFLKELRDHAEDSGGQTQSLGDPKELSRLYRRMFPVWPRFLLFLSLMLILVVCLSAGSYMLSIDETPMETQLMYEPYGSVVGIAGFVGYIQMMFAIPLALVAMLIFGDRIFFVSLPIFAYGLWTLILAVLILPTPWQIARLAVGRFKK